MGRLIDEDGLKHSIWEYTDKYGHIEMTINFFNILLERNRVDAVEVVRCKDCKYSEPSVYPQAVNCTVLSKAIREWAEGYGCPATDLIMTVFEDHYCGWGEKRK